MGEKITCTLLKGMESKCTNENVICYGKFEICMRQKIVGVVFKKRGGDSFSNAFGRPLKFALLHHVLKLYKEYVFNRDTPQWSYLCELCENVTLLATVVNKGLKEKLPTSPHDIVKKFSSGKKKVGIKFPR